MEVNSARGRADDTQRALQELVDVVARHGRGNLVWERIAASARYWARKAEYEAAATLFSLSIAYAVEDEDGSDKEFTFHLARPLVYIALAARHDGINETELYDALIRDMSDRFKMDGETIRAHLVQISGELPPEESLDLGRDE